MHGIATTMDQVSEVRQSVGTVTDADGESLRVEMEGRTVLARRAVSCLIEPSAGDTVLVTVGGSARPYVLAVLERTGDAGARIAVEGDLTVQVRGGRLSMSATEGIALASSRDLTLASADLDVRAASGWIVLDHLSYLGGLVHAQARRINLFAGIFDSVLERLSQKMKRSYRVIEEMDFVQSGEISYRASKNLDLRAENALVTAKDLVRVDGAQIHLG